jgi:hypothetical protein
MLSAVTLDVVVDSIIMLSVLPNGRAFTITSIIEDAIKKVSQFKKALKSVYNGSFLFK